MRRHAMMRWLVLLAILGFLSAVLGPPALAKEPVPPKSKGETKASPAGELPAAVTIVNKWDGDYPVSALKKLPRGQQKTSAGYIRDEKSFADIWKSFKPGERVPSVDFRKNMVVFTRNVKFYNRKAITKVTLLDGVMEIQGVETVTSVPVTDKVAMAMAEVPRLGVKTLRAGDKFIPVK
ncbi:MAG TPA: hypothetical protein VMB77_02380 [Syntrophales bacterium]|nr:hypothetical protein [Syntrophales bacterium]